jgi:ABC-type phosphate/phosphonate transport system substrate-binding protein
MRSVLSRVQKCVRCAFLGGFLPSLLILFGAAERGRPAKIDLLRIGTTGTMSPEGDGRRDKGAMKSLRRFAENQTRLTNEIRRQKGWRELADELTQGKLHLGVFQGYEFAWAQEEFPQLRPLALAVNVYRYPVACVVVRKDNPAKDFAGLQGQSLALVKSNQRFLSLFVDSQCEARGKKTDEVFSKIATPDNFEDALDDLVDGVVQATVTDRATLEAYKQRKPGRYRRLKIVAQSQRFPPAVVAYSQGVMDKATLRRFRKGLLDASKKETGRTMLTLFRLTGFQPVPKDFEQVLAKTRKAYPPPAPGK